jgi:hypothetical protein
LVRLAARVTPEEWAAGAEWYPSEAGWIAEQAATYGRSPIRAMCAYAALSPRLQLGRNRIALIMLLEGHRPKGVFSRNIDNATRCMADGCLPRGPKVHNFALNLMGCSEAVTVDVWAMRAAGFSGESPGTAKQYKLVANAYRDAARRIGTDARTLQAVTWLHVRGTKPTD